MADAPDWRVDYLRTRLQLKQQQAALDGQRVALVEIAQRKRQTLTNVEAHRKAIGELQERLRQLEAEHGTLGEDELEQMIAEL